MVPRVRFFGCQQHARNRLTPRPLSRDGHAGGWMSDTLRPEELRRTALMGTALLALVCMAMFAVARLSVA
jgi:hypothetical protein